MVQKPNQPEPHSRFAVYLPKKDYLRLRAKLILEGTNSSEWFRTVVRNFLKENDEAKKF